MTTRQLIYEDDRTKVYEVLDDGGQVIGTDTETEPTTDEQAHDTRESNLAGAIATLRTWSDQAAATNVTQGNAVATLQTVVTRLGVFFDRFADLLENRR